MLRPADRSIATGEILDDFANANRAIDQFDPPLDLETRHRQVRARDERRAGPLEIVRRDRRLAVDRQAGCGLFGRWATENIEAQVVPHDSAEELPFRAAAVVSMMTRAERGRLNRR